MKNNKNNNWTYEARQIVKILNEIYSKSKNLSNLIIILRHSHRINTKDPNILRNLGLTKKGKIFALNFGKNLPNFNRIKILYSNSIRCEETAKKLCTGAKSNNLNVKLMGHFNLNILITEDNNLLTKEPLKKGINLFLENYFSNKYPSNIIKPFEEYCIEIKNYFNNLIKNNVNTTLIIITHDIFIKIFLNCLFNNYYNEYYSPSFLGGFGFSIENNDKFKLMFSGTQKFLNNFQNK
ncbi:MAG: hypothetical protein ACTSPY_05800 [Candidatus Helarchaeota archaeon]